MLDAKAFANAAAVVAAVVFVVCRILVGVMPNGMFQVAQSWMHSIAVSPSSMMGYSFGSGMVLGIVTMVVVVWLIAYAFASLYNSWANKK